MDRFKFEREGLDFPLYNDDSVQAVHIAVMLASVLVACVVPNVVSLGLWSTCGIIVLGTVVPFLWAARGKIGAVVKAPKPGDILLALGMLVLTYVYTTVVALGMKFLLGIEGSGHPMMQMAPSEFNAGVLLPMIIQLFGEEMLKVDILLAVLWLVYRKTGNRKQGVVIGVVAALTVFALIHMGTYGNVLQILLIQGLGDIFCMFGYLKTKNVLVSYTTHLLTDLIPVLLIVSGVYASLG